MRPKEPRQTGQADMFRSRLDQISATGHPSVKPAQKIDWRFLEAQFFWRPSSARPKRIDRDDARVVSPVVV